jgi:type IV secretory pathway TrbL component
MLPIRNNLPSTLHEFFSRFSLSVDLPFITPYSFLVFLVGFKLTMITYILSIPFFLLPRGGFTKFFTQRYGYRILSYLILS